MWLKVFRRRPGFLFTAVVSLHSSETSCRQTVVFTVPLGSRKTSKIAVGWTQKVIGWVGRDPEGHHRDCTAGPTGRQSWTWSFQTMPGTLKAIPDDYRPARAHSLTKRIPELYRLQSTRRQFTFTSREKPLRVTVTRNNRHPSGLDSRELQIFEFSHVEYKTALCEMFKNKKEMKNEQAK